MPEFFTSVYFFLENPTSTSSTPILFYTASLSVLGKYYVTYFLWQRRAIIGLHGEKAGVYVTTVIGNNS